eukprot:1891286-Pyramimonas_sp.AAC.1
MRCHLTHAYTSSQIWQLSAASGVSTYIHRAARGACLPERALEVGHHQRAAGARQADVLASWRRVKGDDTPVPVRL